MTVSAISGKDYLTSILAKLLGVFSPQCSSTLYSIWPFKHFLIRSVTDDSFVNEKRVWRKHEILILVSMMSLFVTTVSMVLLVEIYFPRVSPAQKSALLC